MSPESYPYIKPGEGEIKNDTDVTLRTGASRSTVTTSHYHTFTITTQQANELKADRTKSLNVTTSTANGHEHDLVLFWNGRRLVYRTCDKKRTCWDGHVKPLIVVEAD